MIKSVESTNVTKDKERSSDVNITSCRSSAFFEIVCKGIDILEMVGDPGKPLIDAPRKQPPEVPTNDVFCGFKI